MKAVILAAGDNTRFRKNNKQNKLLHPVLGLPLLERTIRSAKEAGVVEFIIVTGYQDSEIKGLLGDGKKIGVNIIYVHNQSWRGENGISVYTAKDLIDDNFILLMGDHLFDPKALLRLKETPLGQQECVLAVDKKIKEYPNINEATKVQIEKGKITAIGKELKTFRAIDTGMFLCSPYLFSVLEKTIKNKNFYLTDAMRILAKERRLRSYDIKNAFWADIDTHADLYMAEEELFRRLTEPNEEGPVSKYFNRHFSHTVTRLVIKTNLTPNQITFLSFLVAIAAGVLLANPSSKTILFGGILAQFSSILDGVDGEVARIKFSSSPFGAWFDTLLDRYGDTAIIAGAAIGAAVTSLNFFTVLVAIAALTGSIMSSYSVHTFKTTFGKSFKEVVGEHFAFLSKRDMRLFVIFIGGLLNLVLPALFLIAFLTHWTVISRLFSASRIKFK